MRAVRRLLRFFCSCDCMTCALGQHCGFCRTGNHNRSWCSTATSSRSERPGRLGEVVEQRPPDREEMAMGKEWDPEGSAYVDGTPRDQLEAMQQAVIDSLAEQHKQAKKDDR